MRLLSVVSIGIVVFGASGLAGAINESVPTESQTLPVRGIVRPLQQAAVTSELQARVVEVRHREGETFSKGDLLVEFDCERQRSEFDAASAQLRETKAAFDSASYLDRKGASGRLEVDIARARMEKNEAEVAGLTAKLKLCKIFAPFDGRLAERFVQAHEVPTVGKPLITVVDESVFEIELIVPSNWLRRVSPGSRFSFSVDELGEAYEARLVRIGAIVDPVSQTAKVYGVFEHKPGRVLAGMSGSAVFVGVGK